jgi:hypothetical protein
MSQGNFRECCNCAGLDYAGAVERAHQPRAEWQWFPGLGWSLEPKDDESFKTLRRENRQSLRPFRAGR